MVKKLTAKTIENIKPKAHRFEVPDGGCRGLYLVVQPSSGHKSWAVRYRFNNKPRKLTLEGVGSLAAARKAATDALHDLEQKIDPAAKKFDAKAAAEKAAAERAADTVEWLATQFIERHVRKLRPATQRQIEHVLDHTVLPAWSGRSVHDIRRRDCIDLIDGVAAERGAIAANRQQAWVAKFFNWLVARDVITASPMAGLPRPSKEHPRERVLGDGEIKDLWDACEAIGDPRGAFVRTLLLTGQRRSEVAGMRRSEIVGDLWTLAAARTKNAKAHTVPFSAQVSRIIEQQPRIAGAEDYVFTTGKGPIGRFDRIKAALDAQMQPSAGPWVMHDLRRTMASGLQKLGVPLEVTEAVLNHAGGSRGGIVGVYQTHQYGPEKRAALQRWADHIEGLVSGKPARAVADIITARKARMRCAAG